MSGLWLFVLFALAGIGSWLVEYHGQKDHRYPGLVVRPPRAITWLCGDPRGDGTIDLDSGVRQLSALVFLLGAPVICLLPLDLSRRAALVFLAYAVISVPGFFLGEWARWRRSHKQGAELDAAAARPRIAGSQR